MKPEARIKMTQLFVLVTVELEGTYGGELVVVRIVRGVFNEVEAAKKAISGHLDSGEVEVEVYEVPKMGELFDINEMAPVWSIARNCPSNNET